MVCVTLNDTSVIRSSRYRIALSLFFVEPLHHLFDWYMVYDLQVKLLAGKTYDGVLKEEAQPPVNINNE